MHWSSANNAAKFLFENMQKHLNSVRIYSIVNHCQSAPVATAGILSFGRPIQDTKRN